MTRRTVSKNAATKKRRNALLHKYTEGSPQYIYVREHSKNKIPAPSFPKRSCHCERITTQKGLDKKSNERLIVIG